MGCYPAASALYHQQGCTKLDVQKDSQVLEFGLIYSPGWLLQLMWGNLQRHL